MAEAVFAWISNVSGSSVSGIEDLKNGVILCETANALRPNTIRQVSNYKAAYACMKNIDNFLKVAEKLGVAKEDRFSSEDLYYENNVPKVILTLTLFADAAAEKFGCDGLSTGGVDALRAEAASSQKSDGKKRQKYTGLGIFDSNAKGFQDIASEEKRTKNRLVKKDMQDHAITSDLGLFDSNAKGFQDMANEEKRTKNKLVKKDMQDHAITSDLGLFDSNAKGFQDMANEERRTKNRLVKKDMQQHDSSSLALFQADQVDKQQMIKKSLASGQDLIIRTKEEAAVTGDLGYIDAEARQKQTLASGAHKNTLDLILKNQGADEEDDGDF